MSCSEGIYGFKEKGEWGEDKHKGNGALGRIFG